jgi:TRAP transporter TAXI family solute receptor
VRLAARFAIGAALVASAQVVVSDQSAAQEKTSIVLGTATPGGGFPLYGGVLAEVVNATDPSLSIEPRNTKGSTENVPLLEEGKLDIALVQGEVAYEALAGIGRAPADLKIIAAMYSTPACSSCARTALTARSGT